MGTITKISWTDHTFNPWIGCTKVSEGCRFCYAERQNGFYHWNRNGWGPLADRHRTSAANWEKPLTWNNAAERAGIRRRVFCASLADVCDDHPSIEAAWYDDLSYLVHHTQNLDWLFLTKRPENFVKLYQFYFDMEHMPDNLWIGTTVEDQSMANIRIPVLSKIKAKVRFLSCEPLLEHVFLNMNGINAGVIQWVIVGGESGPNARPLVADWVHLVRDQCSTAGVPFFFKQWGGNEKIDGVWGGDQLDERVYHEFPGERIMCPQHHNEAWLPGDGLCPNWTWTPSSTATATNTFTPGPSHTATITKTPTVTQTPLCGHDGRILPGLTSGGGNE